MTGKCTMFWERGGKSPNLDLRGFPEEVTSKSKT